MIVASSSRVDNFCYLSILRCWINLSLNPSERELLIENKIGQTIANIITKQQYNHLNIKQQQQYQEPM